MTTTTGSALKSRQRARERRLVQMRERRLRLDPERAERDRRIDEAALDLEDARDALAKARDAQDAAELRMAAAVRRLVAERLTIAEVSGLTGLEQPLLRRLRQMTPPGIPTETPNSQRIVGAQDGA